MGHNNSYWTSFQDARYMQFIFWLLTIVKKSQQAKCNVLLPLFTPKLNCRVWKFAKFVKCENGFVLNVWYCMSWISMESIRLKCFLSFYTFFLKFWQYRWHFLKKWWQITALLQWWISYHATVRLFRGILRVHGRHDSNENIENLKIVIIGECYRFKQSSQTRKMHFKMHWQYKVNSKRRCQFSLNKLL